MVSDTASTATAIYLVGHGPLREPRLIELQYNRIIRYWGALGEEAGSAPDVFTDLNYPRSSSGPQGPEELPAFTKLLDRVRVKAYGLVLMDLQDGSFESDALMFIRPSLEQAGARVLNVFYDDERALEQALKKRWGKGALVDDLTDGSDLVCFFPGLASEITTASLRRELETGDLQPIKQRIDFLKKLRPYAGGRRPFIEDRLSLEWQRRNKND